MILEDQQSDVQLVVVSDVVSKTILESLISYLYTIKSIVGHTNCTFLSGGCNT